MHGLNNGPIGVVEEGTGFGIEALDAGTKITEADSRFDLTVDSGRIQVGTALRGDGKGVDGGILGMKKTLAESLKASWDEFGVLPRFVRSGRSKKDSFKEEDETEEGVMGIFGGRTKGGITISSEC